LRLSLRLNAQLEEDGKVLPIQLDFFEVGKEPILATTHIAQVVRP
jgi:hypothetical protein